MFSSFLTFFFSIGPTSLQFYNSVWEVEIRVLRNLRPLSLFFPSPLTARRILSQRHYCYEWNESRGCFVSNSDEGQLKSRWCPWKRNRMLHHFLSILKRPPRLACSSANELCLKPPAERAKTRPGAIDYLPRETTPCRRSSDAGMTNHPVFPPRSLIHFRLVRTNRPYARLRDSRELTRSRACARAC